MDRAVRRLRRRRASLGRLARSPPANPVRLKRPRQVFPFPLPPSPFSLSQPMPAFESLLYEISRFFLAPVLVLLAAMFAYALYCLGALLAESALRGVRGHGRR